MQSCPNDLIYTYPISHSGTVKLHAIPLAEGPCHQAENTDITSFFSALYGNTTGFIAIWDKQSKQTRWFSTARPDEIGKTCQAMAAKGQDVYFGVGLQEGALNSFTRGTSETVSTLPGFWVDIDIFGPGHSKSDLPQTKEDALQILEIMPFEPSVVVDSGGGLHTYWLFNSPWVFETPEERSKAQRLSAQFQLLLRQEAKKHGWSLDNTADLARVLRVPFTRNCKDPERPRNVVILKADYFRRYDPKEFEDFLETATRMTNDPTDTTFEQGPGNAVDIVSNCRFIQHCRDDNQSLSEPDWHAMITLLLEVKGGKELIHKFSDSYPGGSWEQTEQKIQDAERTGLPCSCSYIKNELGFDCPENGCNVASPISFANNPAVVARLRINELLPKILQNEELCFEKATLKWLNIIYQTDDLEWARIKRALKGKVHQIDLNRAMKRISHEDTTPDRFRDDDFSMMNDLGNARRFTELYADRIQYCNQTKQWYRWDGKRWAEDNTQQVKVWATESLSHFEARAKAELHGNKRDDFLNWSNRSRSNSGLKAMLELSQCGAGIPIELKDFDQDPYLINCQNGTFNLRTGELQPHNPSDLLTQITPIDYDPNAECTIFKSFLEKALYGDQEAIEYLILLMGITLSGLNIKKVFFVYGLPDTGKSIFIALLHYLLGSYGMSASMDMLLASKNNNSSGANPELFKLQKARGAFAAETVEGRRLDAALVKRLSGGDKITVRNLFSSPVEFTPYFKLWIHGNHRPYISAEDEGVWNRLSISSFNNVIPADEQDMELLDKLKAESAGIFVLATRACKDWIEGGAKLPETPKRFATEAQEYRESVDVLGHFLDENCIIDPKVKVGVTELYQKYMNYCEINGEKPPTSRAFGNKMISRRFKKNRSSKFWYWEGIALTLDNNSPSVQFEVDLAVQNALQGPPEARETVIPF